MDDSFERQIVTTIFQQLGGQGFAVMVGLITPILFRIPCEGEVTAIFRWKAKSTDGLNLLEVTYCEGPDTYRVTFGRITGRNVIRRQPLESVYCDMLAPLFRETTGLDVTPPTFIINGTEIKP